MGKSIKDDVMPLLFAYSVNIYVEVPKWKTRRVFKNIF